MKNPLLQGWDIRCWMLEVDMQREEIKQLITRLEQYNEWRRGADTEMPPPKQIGADIDAAVEVLREYLHHHT